MSKLKRNIEFNMMKKMKKLNDLGWLKGLGYKFGYRWPAEYRSQIKLEPYKQITDGLNPTDIHFQIKSIIKYKTREYFGIKNR